MGKEVEQNAENGYDEGHGDVGSILRADEERDGTLPAPPGPFGARDSLLEELCALNRSIHEDDGRPERYALDQRSPLVGRIDAFLAEDKSTPEGICRAAAVLAHGIAQSQSFHDGNRRTAFVATRGFFEIYGLPHLSTGNDDQLTRLLNQVVRRQGRPWLGLPPKPGRFEELFLRRLQNRTPRGTR